jgi:hypothetical protein
LEQSENERARKGKARRKKSSFSSEQSSAVTFRFSTERNVKRLAAAEAVPATTVTSSSRSSKKQPHSLKHRCGYFQKTHGSSALPCGAERRLHSVEE